METYPTSAFLTALTATTGVNTVLAPGVRLPYFNQDPEVVPLNCLWWRFAQALLPWCSCEPYKDDGSALTLGIRPNPIANALLPIVYAGGTIAMADNAVNYVYLTAAGTLAAVPGAWPAQGESPYFPLAIVRTGNQSEAGTAGQFDFDDMTDARLGVRSLVRHPMPLAGQASDFLYKTLQTSATEGIPSGIFRQGLDAIGSTVANTITIEYSVPQGFVPCGNMQIVTAAQLAGLGVAGACTLTAAAYALDSTGAAVGGNLVTTAAQAIPAAWTDLIFAVRASALHAGQRLLIVLQSSVTETGGASAISAKLGRVALDCDSVAL